MEEIVNKIIEEKLKDGTIENIISAKIDEAITAILNDEFGYCGAARKAITKKFEPLILNAVDKSDLSASVVIIQEAIKKAIKESPISVLKDTCSTLDTLFGLPEDFPKVKFGDTMKLSEVFALYCKYIEKNSDNLFDKDELEGEGLTPEFEDGKCFFDVEASYEVGDSDERYLPKKCVKFFTGFDDASTDITFKLTRGSSYDTYHIDFDLDELPLSTLFARHDAFMSYLLCLRAYFIDIKIDDEYRSEAITLEVDDD